MLNDMMAPRELIPSLLVFRTFSTFAMIVRYIPEKTQCMEMIYLTHNKVDQRRAEQRNATSLTSNISPQAKYVLNTGDGIKVFSKNEKKWLRGLTVVKVDGKCVWINIEERLVKVIICDNSIKNYRY